MRSGGPRHVGGPLFCTSICAPEIAPNCPNFAPKTCLEQPLKATSEQNEKPLEPLRFKGFGLVETTELERHHLNISVFSHVFSNDILSPPKKPSGLVLQGLESI